MGSLDRPVELAVKQTTLRFTLVATPAGLSLRTHSDFCYYC